MHTRDDKALRRVCNRVGSDQPSNHELIQHLEFLSNVMGATILY